MKYDAIIVGGRVAGSSTAMLMARAGAKVLLVDRASEIGDTLSTHALMRAAVALLDEWGLAEGLVEAGTPSVDWTTFQYDAEQIRIPIKPSGRVGGLLAPRRWLLDRSLAEAAVAAGAELRLGTSFEGCLIDDDGRSPRNACDLRLRDDLLR